MQIPKTSLRLVCHAGICICLSLCVSAFCLAQRYTFRDYTEGLGNLDINCMAQDRTGYLWIGTENGLYRYDGHQFKQFGPAEGIRARTIRNLFLGPDGTLWVGTSTSIYFQRNDGGFREVIAPAPFSQFSQRIGSTFTSPAPGQIVIADRSGAFLLRKTQPGRWTPEPMHLEGSAIWSVLAAPGGVLWYGCDLDLCRLAAGKTTRMAGPLRLPAQQWSHLLLAGDGSIWLRGSSHLGVLWPAENRFELRDLPGRANPVPYFALAQDAQGRIAASQGPAFGLWEKGHWRMVTERNGLSRFDLSTLFVDREGSLWLAVIGHGLRRWLGQGHWEALTDSEGLSNDIVWAELRDSQGRLWIATESGLDWTPHPGDDPRPWAAPGIETTRACALAETADGAIWIGSAAGALLRIDPGGRAAHQWSVPEVYRILADKANRLWVATGEGLFVADTAGKSRAPKLVESSAFKEVRKRFSDLALETDNRLWAASDQGLFLLNGSTWQRIDPGFSEVTPYNVASDGRGNLWAAGTFPGVVRLRIAGGKVIESEHIARPSLLSDQVVALMVDSRGYLWVGQDAGLTVFDGQTWKSLTQDDGLIWNDIDADAMFQDPDGSVWIGTSGGLSHLIKPEIQRAAPPAAPVLSQILFGAAAVHEGSAIPWTASPLTISVSTLSFRDEPHLGIRYRLVGLESEWEDTLETSLRYPRLPPGDYRFEVVAVNTSDRASSPLTSISFSVTPRWWQSPLLRILAGLLAVLALAALWRWRHRLLLRQKRQLEIAVQRRTEDLEREKAELLSAREQMRHFAEHDGLTGLWNHRVVIEHLQHEVERSRRDQSPLSAILVDIDHFKEINDTCGHQTGDLVLQEVALVFQRSTRSYDWVGRYGGDEFLLILPRTGLESALARAEQMRADVQSVRIPHGDRFVPLSASFGVASGIPTGHDALVQAADAALYRAKQDGRNRAVSLNIQLRVNAEHFDPGI